TREHIVFLWTSAPSSLGKSPPINPGRFTLRREYNLIAQVGHAVVDGRGRKHQHARLHALADDLAHQAVVAGLTAGLWGFLVAEVVRFVDDDEVVVAPVDVREVDVPGHPAI